MERRLIGGRSWGQSIAVRLSGARGQRPTDPASDARQHGERARFGRPADCQPDQPLKASLRRRPPTRDAGRGGERTNFPAHDRRGNGQLPRQLSGNCRHSEPAAVPSAGASLDAATAATSGALLNQKTLGVGRVPENSLTGAVQLAARLWPDAGRVLTQLWLDVVQRVSVPPEHSRCVRPLKLTNNPAAFHRAAFDSRPGCSGEQPGDCALIGFATAPRRGKCHGKNSHFQEFISGHQTCHYRRQFSPFWGHHADCFRNQRSPVEPQTREINRQVA